MTQTWHLTHFRVPYKDTDRMGVVHHGNYIVWFENARTECMRHYGFTYQKMESLGFFLPVLDANLTYKNSAGYDDDIIVFTKIASYSPVRLEFAYEARKVDENDWTRNEKEAQEPYGELLTKGVTKHMWVNQSWKPARMDREAPDIYALVQNAG